MAHHASEAAAPPTVEARAEAPTGLRVHRPAPPRILAAVRSAAHAEPTKRARSRRVRPDRIVVDVADGFAQRAGRRGRTGDGAAAVGSGAGLGEVARVLRFVEVGATTLRTGTVVVVSVVAAYTSTDPISRGALVVVACVLANGEGHRRLPQKLFACGACGARRTPHSPHR